MMSHAFDLQPLRRAIAVLCAGAREGARRPGTERGVRRPVAMLPVASVVGTASTVVAVPAKALAMGAVLTVKAVEVSARGTVVVLERASDGAAASIELGAAAAGGVALSVGASVTTTVIASGVVLSAKAAERCAIPNAIGRALLYDERIL